MYSISYMMSSVYFSRATGDATSAISYFEESVDFLKKIPEDDLEVGRCNIILQIIIILKQNLSHYNFCILVCADNTYPFGLSK